MIWYWAFFSFFFLVMGVSTLSLLSVFLHVLAKGLACAPKIEMASASPPAAAPATAVPAVAEAAAPVHAAASLDEDRKHAAAILQARARGKQSRARVKKKVRRKRDLDEEAAIKQSADGASIGSSIGSAVITFIQRRTAFVVMAMLGSFILVNWEISHGLRSIVGWTLIGAAASACGAMIGVTFALCSPSRGDTPISRVSCGAFSSKCCATCCADVGKAFYALVLSLLFAAALGGLTAGLLALLLEYEPLVTALDLPAWALGASRSGQAWLMWAIVAVIFAYQAIRHYFKTRRGWWKRGDALTDDDDSNDLMALL